MKSLFAALLLSTVAFTAQAQSAPAFTSSCNSDGRWNSDSQQRYCETRDLTLPGIKSGKLTVDGLRNGGISVKGYSGTDIRVRAKVQAWAKTEADAKARVAGVKISTDGNTLRAAGPDGSGANSGYAVADGGYAVSYEIFVPEKTALALSTHNGGIHLENLRGPVTFEAENGGVNITGAGGDVKGHTKNGGLSITLTGAKWDGPGLDVATTNGGISWKVPADYSAQLFTSTQHGPIRTDFPTKVEGSIGREVSVALGRGGSPIKAVTTNGGVTVSRAGN
jgi:hypothetical protein